MAIRQEIEHRAWSRAMECNSNEHASAALHHASIRDAMDMGDNHHRRNYSSHHHHHYHAMESYKPGNIGGGGSPLDAAAMAAAALLLQRSSSATSQYVHSQMSSQITHDDDADFGDSSASKPSRPPPEATACSLQLTPSPPLMIPRLETPDRTPPDSFDNDSNRFSAGNHLFYGSGDAAWQTWGSDLEMAGDGRTWRPGAGRFSDFLLPPAASQGASLNLASSSPMHGECPPWSPSLLDLNLQIPADFHHLFTSSGGTGEDSFSYSAGFSVEASAQCGADAGADHQQFNHILGCSTGRDDPTVFGVSDASVVGFDAVTGARECTIGGSSGVNVNALQMKEDGSSTVDCFPLDYFGFDLSSCSSSNFFYPDCHQAGAPALHVDATSDSPMLESYDAAAAPPPFLQQMQRGIPELVYPEQSSDLFSGGFLPVEAAAYSGAASASNNNNKKNRQAQYSLEAAYSASTTTTTTTTATTATSGDVCWDGTRRRRKGGSGGGSKNGGDGGGGGIPAAAAANTHNRGTSERVTELTLQELSQYFNMPITQASKELKVGLTVLKKKCREFGIPRWPHRKMKSLDSLITNIQDLAGEHGGKGSARVLNAVKELEEQKRLMEEMPGIELAERTKRLRQACFKASYKKRRLLLSQQQQQSTTNSMD